MGEGNWPPDWNDWWEGGITPPDFDRWMHGRKGAPAVHAGSTGLGEEYADELGWLDEAPPARSVSEWEADAQPLNGGLARKGGDADD